MDYISVKEASEKWNISPRRVQILCSQTRIDNAVKVGNSWLVPKNAKKPARKTKNDSTVISENNISVIDQIHDEFYSGRYQDSKKTAISVIMSDDILTQFNAVIYTAFSSIYLGEKTAISAIMQRIEDDLKKYRDNDAVTACITLARDAVNIETYNENNLSDMILMGDFSELPPILTDFAYLAYCKYLIMTRRFYQLYGTARTALNYMDDKDGIFAMYMHLFLASSFYFSNNPTFGDKEFRLALELDKNGRYTHPVTDIMLPVKDCCRGLFSTEYKEYIKEYPELWKTRFDKWLSVHNILYGKEYTSELTYREYSVASLAAIGYTNNEIAEKLDLSGSTIKKILQEIYLTLGINCRNDLERYVLTKNIPNLSKNGGCFFWK